jgi:hypothetical protein
MFFFCWGVGVRDEMDNGYYLVLLDGQMAENARIKN